jgi:hypothetical protein
MTKDDFNSQTLWSFGGGPESGKSGASRLHNNRPLFDFTISSQNEKIENFPVRPTSHLRGAGEGLATPPQHTHDDAWWDLFFVLKKSLELDHYYLARFIVATMKNYHERRSTQQD